MKIKHCTVFIMIVMGFTSLCMAIHAAASPQLTLQVREGLQAGIVTDGTVLAYGTVRDTDTTRRVGFKVWSDAHVNGSLTKYTLNAQGNTGYRLQMRLVGEGWKADVEQGQGIILPTVDSQGTFRVEVDGDQTLPAALWHLQLQAVTLTP